MTEEKFKLRKDLIVRLLREEKITKEEGELLMEYELEEKVNTWNQYLDTAQERFKQTWEEQLFNKPRYIPASGQGIHIGQGLAGWVSIDKAPPVTIAENQLTQFNVNGTTYDLTNYPALSHTPSDQNENHK